jgi:lantibiotic modifying enzyme
MPLIARPIDREIEVADYLQAAIGIAENLKQHEKISEYGKYWVTLPDSDGPQIDFYSGSAGIILFFIELAKATGDESYLAEAVSGTELILHLAGEHEKKLSGLKQQQSWLSATNANSYLNIAFTFIELAKVTQDKRYDNFAKDVIEEVIEQAETVEAGLIFSGIGDVGQDAGIVLNLLDYSKYFNEPGWVAVAVKAADAILATEIQAGPDGARYPGYKNLFERIRDGDWSGKVTFDPSFFTRFFPNFNHGVSGVGFVFAKLYGVTKDEKYLVAARKAAQFVQDIAVDFGEGKLIPYLQPNNDEGIFYLSYCHGPAGTSRLYYELYVQTGEVKYLEFFEELFEGIVATGAPEKHSSGYWNNHSQCCGTAGILHGFLGAYFVTADEKYLGYAKRTAEVILGEATVEDSGAYKWYQAWSRQDPDVIENILGFNQGDAGLGDAFLELDGAITKTFEAVRLYDDPFPSKIQDFVNV